ncbi:MAG TPA: pilus assembly protein TadG-related protein [Alphaproteobacteria bacterium]|nr:pilus assembly protein TadG-related protein [Alphaproteobacteria bacterium]
MFFSNRLRERYCRGKTFVRKDAGVVAIIYALALVPVFGMLGLSIDVGRDYYVHSVITGAADAAAIAGAKAGGSTANMTQQATAIFNANIPKDFIGTLSGPSVQLSGNGQVITVTATATIDTTFMQILGKQSISATATSQAQIQVQGAEVVLALDNTGSMAGAPMSGEIAAAQSLVNILYGGTGTSGGTDTVTGLYVGVVPYSTTVNINMAGFTPSNWLTTAGKAQVQNTNLYPNIASNSRSVGGNWMGCIEARTPITSIPSSSVASYGYTSYPNGTDSTDATPSAFPFTPYLYPSTMVHEYVFGEPLNRGTTKTSNNASGTPPWGKNGNTRGDNDWRLDGRVPNNSGLRFGDNYALAGGDGNLGVGPNLGCPIPMLPLTASQTTVQNTISDMKATFRGGTMINVGLAAAWWMVSPNWTGLWPSPTPSTEPLAYGKTMKVIVLMTDGQNTWYDWPTGVPGQPDTSHNYAKDADYTGYGRLAEGRSGTTNPNQTINVLNNSMANMCTTLKNNGITIYTIIFNHDGSASSSDTQALFRNCASDSSKYFLSVTNADLLAAFQNIGQSISSLRLTWPGTP